MVAVGLFICFLVLGAWFTWVLRRFQLLWDAGDQRISNLGAALRQAQRLLAEEQRNQEKMMNEAKQFDRKADKAREDEQMLRQKQLSAPPPPPTEILVSSEFPASASEEAWIANLIRRYAARPGDRPPRPLLFWGAGYQAAMSRVQHMAGEFAVNDIRKMTAAK